MSWENQYNENLNYLINHNLISRLWSNDYGLWNFNSEDSIDKLGWLNILDFINNKKEYIYKIKDEIWNENFNQIVLLGMGGSSLGAEVIYKICQLKEPHLNLLVVDTTVPDSINFFLEKIDLEKSLFIVASKSGATLEPLLLYKFFKDKLKNIFKDENELGKRFLAITDEGTPLGDLALKDKFRHVIYNPSNIGGRYSVLSFFGLIPAVLCGIDLDLLLNKAKLIEEESKSLDLDINSAARLSAFMSAMFSSGKDKMTLVISEKIKTLGMWIEQLVAESSGKDGVGLIPIYDEPLISEELYSDDRCFIYIKIGQDKRLDSFIDKIDEYGHPSIKFELDNEYDIAGEFFRWEFATALLGAFLNINPFDQPNGQLSKDITARFLSEDISFSDNELPYSFSSLKEMLLSAKPNSYLAIMAYIDNNYETSQILESLRKRIVSEYGIATTLGYGPRFLHSTGQLHKGGINSGLFLQITESNKLDFNVPDETYSFSKLLSSQALGDRLALALNARKVMHIDIGSNLLSLEDLN